MKDRTRFEANERVDLVDFEKIGGEHVQGHFEQVVGGLFTSPFREQRWVLSGFGMSNPSGSQVQVDRGRAILAERRDGQVHYGIMATEGDTVRIVDINTYSPGTYGIYIRFESIPGDEQSRIFWDPAGAGEEYPKTIPTKYLANWSVRVENASPGAEWLKIGEVDQATMAITDQRKFYFEGDLANSFESGWSTDGGGVATDRSSDRLTYGIIDLQTAFAATRQCLEDIKGRGLRKWYSRDIAGMNIGFDDDPTNKRLAVGDDEHFLSIETTDPAWRTEGVWPNHSAITYSRFSNSFWMRFVGSDSYEFDANEILPQSSQALGSSLYPWGDIFTEQINIEADSPYLRFYEGDFSSNAKNWRFYVDGGEFNFQTGNDAETAWNKIFSVHRVGADPQQIKFWNVGMEVHDSTPGFAFYDENGSTPADENIWRWASSLGSLFLMSINDAETLVDYAIELARTGYQTDTIKFGPNITSIYPTADETTDLGDGSYKWNNVVTRALDVKNESGYGVVSDLVPDSSGSIDLGKFARYYRECFATQLTAHGDAGAPMSGASVPGAGSVTYTGLDVGVTLEQASSVYVSNATGVPVNSGWVKIYLGDIVGYIPWWSGI